MSLPNVVMHIHMYEYYYRQYERSFYAMHRKFYSTGTIFTSTKRNRFVLTLSRKTKLDSTN